MARRASGSGRASTEQHEEVHGQDRLEAGHAREIDRRYETVALQLEETFLDCQSAHITGQ